MNDLNSTQLILLALLVSFVTSIATGIVTVTLMDQAPPAVTQTINRVVERTVEVVTPLKDQSAEVIRTVVVKEEEFIAKAAKKNSPNVVEMGRLKMHLRAGGIGKPPTEEFTLNLLGVGFVLNPQLVVSNHHVWNDPEELVVKTTDNHIYRINIAAKDPARDLILFTLGERVESVKSIDVNVEKHKFSKVAIAKTDEVQIGQTAIALGANNGVLLSLGVIAQIQTGDSTGEGGNVPSETSVINATVNIDERYEGGPLINMSGEVVGVNVINANNEKTTVPMHIVETLIEQYQAEQKEE